MDENGGTGKASAGTKDVKDPSRVGRKVFKETKLRKEEGMTHGLLEDISVDWQIGDTREQERGRLGKRKMLRRKLWCFTLHTVRQ